MYSKYKEATNRFVEYMKSACPLEFGAIDTANALMTASDVLSDTGHAMDRSILNDLKLGIRIRNRVAKSIYGGGDDGHK